MKLRRETTGKEGSRDEHAKPERFAKLKKFGKKLARYAIIPATALTLSYAPVAKHINPFHSKPAMAQEVPLAGETSTTKEFYNVHKDSSVIISGEFAGNESGAATQGIVSYKNMVGMGIGYLSFFGGAQTPYVMLRATPHADIKGFKIYYNGSLMFGQINSWLYTYQGIGMGYTAQLPHDLNLSFGVTAGGALAYPKFDNVHFKMTWGTAFGWKDNIAVYGIVETYFAANTAIKSSNVLDYGLRFQSVEGGVVGKYKKMFGILFAKYDVIQSIYGVKGGATIEFSDRVMGHLWLGGGMSRYTDYLAGSLNFLLLAGMKVSIKSTVDTNWEMTYDQYGPGGTPMLPTINNPAYDEPITPYDGDIEARMKMIENFSDFAISYNGASEEEVIAAARWLSRTIGTWGYDFNTLNDMMSMKFFSPRVQWIADTTYQDIYKYTRDLLLLLDMYGSWSNIPENLRIYFENGIAMCTGIHSLTARFLNDNGIHALAVSVNSMGGGHVVTLGMTGKMTFIDDYGDWYETEPHSMAKILEAYARYNGIPTFYSQMFHPTEGYIGTYRTDMGRLMEKIMGGDQSDQMKSFILGLPAH